MTVVSCSTVDCNYATFSPQRSLSGTKLYILHLMKTFVVKMLYNVVQLQSTELREMHNIATVILHENCMHSDKQHSPHHSKV